MSPGWSMLYSVRSRLIVTLVASSVALCACQSDLYTKLGEAEANEIVALLLHNGISASRVMAKDGTSIVRVEESSFADAVSLLSEAGLPKPKFATMGDVFADTKLISSPTEERARFIYATSQELSKTLSEIDGVISARVHLVLPKHDPLKDDYKPSSASVFIKHEAAAPVSALLPQIKTLVANSIEGLTYDRVSVVFVPGERAYRVSAAATVKRSSLAGPVLSNLNGSPYYAAALFSAAAIFLAGVFRFFLFWRRQGWSRLLRNISSPGDLRRSGPSR
jgi:type III secretion protein J